jgi:hypothetical protein
MVIRFLILFLYTAASFYELMARAGGLDIYVGKRADRFSATVAGELTPVQSFTGFQTGPECVGAPAENKKPNRGEASKIAAFGNAQSIRAMEGKLGAASLQHSSSEAFFRSDRNARSDLWAMFKYK